MALRAMLTNGQSRKLSMYFEHCSFAIEPEFLFSRKAAKSAHPDKGGSEDKMAAVNEAYEFLSNPG